MPKSYQAGIGVDSPVTVTPIFSKWVSMPTAESFSLSLGLIRRQIDVAFTAPPTGTLPTQLAVRSGAPSSLPLVRIAPIGSIAWSCRGSATDGSFLGNMTLPAPSALTPVSGVFLQDERFANDPLVGVGLMKITLPGGLFRTAGITFEN